jgi:hypothetical protein
MPGSIWRRIGLRVLATGSDCVCTLAGRLDDALPAYRGHHRQGSAPTDRALRQASVAERPVALPPVHPTKGATMASLLFTCPQTHQKAPTGVETDAQSLRASWKATLKVDCPYCGEVHEISVREAYIDSAILAVTDRLDRV